MTNKAMPFRPFGGAHDLRQTQGPELAEGQPTASRLVPLAFMIKLLQELASPEAGWLVTVFLCGVIRGDDP
jgi:hypothetical protein